MRLPALLCALTLTGCIAPRPRREAAQTPRAARAGSPAPVLEPVPHVFWLRPGDQRFTAPEERGSILGRLTGPALVELLPDDRVRTVDGALSGRLPPDVRRWPGANKGLGLFVQSPVDLHLDAPDGPVVGRAVPGAYLPVIEAGPSTTEVALPGYQVAIESRWRPVRVFVDTRSLGTHQRPLPPAPEEDDLRDHERDLSVVQGGPAFAGTLCGPLRVVEMRDGRPRIAQYRDGVEVVGWARVGFERRRGDFPCPPRVVERTDEAPQPELPEGYLGVDETLDDPLGAVVRRGGSLHWLEQEGFDGLVCTDWRLGPDREDRSRARLVGSFIDDADGDLVITSFIFDYGPRDAIHQPSVTLLGPHTVVRADRGRGPERSPFRRVGLRPPRTPRSLPRSESASARTDSLRSSISMGCGEIYTIVAADSRSIRVVRGQYLFGLVGYWPADAETWYLDRRACVRAAARPIASADRLHGGC